MLVLVGLSIIDAKELKCASDYSYTCILTKKESIPANSEKEGYHFTGISPHIKNDIEHLQFHTKNVAFIPREAFLTFPNLNVISFYNFEMDSLDYEWLSQLTGSFDPRIKKLSISTSLSKIDPRVIEIFKRFYEVNLYGNLCVDFGFDKDSGNFELFDDKLENCFQNFERDRVVVKNIENTQEFYSGNSRNFKSKLDETEKVDGNVLGELINLGDKIEGISAYFANELRKLNDRIDQVERKLF